MTKESIETSTSVEDAKEQDQETEDTQSGSDTAGESKVKFNPFDSPDPNNPYYCPPCGMG
jgi:hypothetical protein